MRRFFEEMNPMLRGFLIIAAIALVVVVLQLYQTLAVVSGLLRIAFFIAIAVFVFLWWRSRRADIDMWSDRSRKVFYAAAILIVLDLALFFSPLAGMVPAYASAAALLYVACVMTQGLAEISWDDLTEYAPAVVTAVSMPLTYSIATGIGLGFITYALAKILAGKFSEAKPAVVILALLFAIKFAVSG